MNKKELLELVKNLQETDDIDSIIQSTELFRNAINIDAFKTRLSADPIFKNFMDSEKNSYHLKNLESWKEKNLESLINDELIKRDPNKTPEQLEIEKLRKQVEDMKLKAYREELKNKAITIATEKELPVELIDHFLGENEEITLANLDKFQEVISKDVNSKIEKRLKLNGSTPFVSIGNTGDETGGIAKELLNLSPSNSNNFQQAQENYFK